jgi:Peptidase C65 Otubain
VRGDGNCYYRAMCYAALEHHIIEGNSEALSHIHKALSTVHFYNVYHRARHINLLARLEKVANGRGWRSSEFGDCETAAAEFFNDMSNRASTTDGALVRAFRQLAAQKLQDMRDSDQRLRSNMLLCEAVDDNDVDKVCTPY